MADADNKPTAEQVETANKTEEAKWQGDFNEDDLKIPYKKEAEDDKSASGSDDSKVNDTAKVIPAKSDEDDDEAYTNPAPVVTVQDPGEYKPADYSFEVTLKDGKTVKVSTQEEADKIADDPDNFETPKQLSEFLRKQMSMERKLERDREKWESDKKTYDEQSETAKQRQETVDTMASEFNYLVSKGQMPAIAKEYLDADWTDPEVAKQPGVKEQIELLNYMVKENEVRAKAGVKPLVSIVDAFNAWQLDTERKKEVEDARTAGEARKAAGARVAGGSPAQQGSYVPKGIAVGNPNVLKRGASVWDN